MATGTVYGLFETGSDALRYVGQTMQSLRDRLQDHLAMAECGGKSPVYAWIRSVRAAGGGIEIRPIRCDVKEADLREVERTAIRDAVRHGAAILNKQLAGTPGSVSVCRMDMDYTAPVLATLLTRSSGRRVSRGEAFLFHVLLLEWMYRQVDPYAKNRREEIARASVLPAGLEAETLATICGWPKRKAHLLMEAMCETQPAILVRTDSGVRMRDFPARYEETRRAKRR